MVLERRLARGLLTVVDTVALDPERRAGYVALAGRFGRPCHAVLFDVPADLCRARNRSRPEPVPTKVLSAQLAGVERARAVIADEGFDGVHPPEPVVVVPAILLAAPESAARQRAAPRPLRFGLQVSSFAWPGGSAAALGGQLAEIARVAEGVGFSSLWLMDHVMQIPQVGRLWEDIPEAWTTLAWLAAHTHSVRLGTLVTGVTLRNPAHLAKIVATADVLSGGRIVCGLGAAWWGDEHRRYGWPFPKLAERYRLLEDALQLLPVMWGPGTPAFRGSSVSVAEAICYPRPVQERVPLLVGGSGERKTLRLVARYADACNIAGDPATVRRKLSVLAGHCDAVGRDIREIRITHLSSAVVGRGRREVAAAVERLAPRTADPDTAGERLVAGTVDEQVGRYRDLADAGVQTAIVALADVATPGALESFAEVISAFEPPDAGGTVPGSW
jgi:F420-dependent oxidoreductase-like protein